MIIDVDHLAISCTDIDEKIKYMTKIGYQPKFVEKKIKNLEIKFEFLDKSPEFHSLALLTSKTSLNIELVDHGYSKITTQYPLIPIMKNVPQDILTKTDQKIECVGNIGYLDGFRFPIIHYENSTRDFQFNNILIKTSNLDESIKFWQYFGFSISFKSDNFIVLRFKPVMSEKTYLITLVVSKGISTSLDIDGPSCVALLSTSAKKERNILRERGYNVSKIENLVVNNKELDVFFIKGGHGELVEIISINQ